MKTFISDCHEMEIDNENVKDHTLAPICRFYTIWLHIINSVKILCLSRIMSCSAVWLLPFYQFKYHPQNPASTHTEERWWDFCQRFIDTLTAPDKPIKQLTTSPFLQGFSIWYLEKIESVQVHQSSLTPLEKK